MILGNVYRKEYPLSRRLLVIPQIAHLRHRIGRSESSVLPPDESLVHQTDTFQSFQAHIIQFQFEVEMCFGNFILHPVLHSPDASVTGPPTFCPARALAGEHLMSSE